MAWGERAPPRGREVMYVTLKVQKSDIKFANGSSTFLRSEPKGTAPVDVALIDPEMGQPAPLDWRRLTPRCQSGAGCVRAESEMKRVRSLRVRKAA